MPKKCLWKMKISHKAKTFFLYIPNSNFHLPSSKLHPLNFIQTTKKYHIGLYITQYSFLPQGSISHYFYFVTTFIKLKSQFKKHKKKIHLKITKYINILINYICTKQKIHVIIIDVVLKIVKKHLKPYLWKGSSRNPIAAASL